MSVAIMGAAAISAAGARWHELGDALERGQALCSDDHALAPGIRAHPAKLDGIAQPGTVKERRLMSRAALLAAMAAGQAMRDAGFAALAPHDREAIGYFLGVGASDGSVDEMTAMLRLSVDHGELSMAKLGEVGIGAVHPLRAFHLLNNFTMCHGAILQGVQGPNGAFFSRGSGTVVALMEAMHAIAEGDCTRALAGGADTALHPVTWAEFERAGLAMHDMHPGEGAALLALARPDAIASSAPQACPLAYIESCEIHPLGRAIDSPTEDDDAAAWSCPDSVRAELTDDPIDDVIIAAWGAPPRDALARIAAEAHPGAVLMDLGTVLGESLAASPALAWVAALARIASGKATRVRVLSAGLDGDVGDVIIASTGDREAQS
jgi:3-oxoacyl-(acyl-carrier-protein) synthase